MRSLFLAAALAVTAIALAGCRGKKPEPVPGPRAAFACEASCVGLALEQHHASQQASRNLRARYPD
jgi:hypothetical protein